MPVRVTVEDIAVEQGVPVAHLFAAKAAACAATAQEVVNNLPVSTDPDRQHQAQRGAVMLAKILYDEGSNIEVTPDQVFTVGTQWHSPTLKQLLMLGSAEGMWVA